MKQIFIIIPSLVPTGPVKGAIALANSLVSNRDVTLVSVKQEADSSNFIDDKVKQICLSELSLSVYGRIREYRSILIKAGGRNKVASISMCFSADLVNFFALNKLSSVQASEVI